MKDKFLGFVILLYSISFQAQTTAVWNGYFSYKNIIALSQNNEQAFASTNINYLKHNTNSFSQETISSIQGLKANSITDLHHNMNLNKTILTNQNGLVIIINEDTKQVNNLVGIVNKPSIPTNQKRINSISEYNERIYLATEYGITELFLNNNLLGDSFMIGTSGESIPVVRVLSFQDNLYAITRFHGIRRASLNGNLIDFANWTTYNNQTWSDGVVFNDKIILTNPNGNLAQNNGNNFVNFHNMGSAILSIKNINNQYLVVNTNSQIKIFSNNLNLLHTVNGANLNLVGIRTSTIVGDKIIVGTENSGLYQIELNNLSNLEDITPSGPEANNIFRIKYANNNLWAVYGQYNIEYNPFPLLNYGASKFNSQTGWFTFPNSEMFNFSALSAIAIHPTRSNEVYFGSYNQGILKKNTNDVFDFFDETNTGNNGLSGIIYNQYIRIGALAFDKDQNLWLGNARNSKPIKVLRKNGNWESYSLQTVLSQLNNDDYKQILVDRNDTKWITTWRNGLIAFNDKLSNKIIKISNGNSDGNLPSLDVRSIALDQSNRLWIGTISGLRIIPSIDRFVNDNVINTNSIIIMEDGLAQELFYDQFINDIEVDGSNNKWVSILDNGVFQVSPDGQEVLNKFTIDNSPLPSNNVNDIEINGETGEVFFATEKGLVSYKGTATAPSSDLNNVYVYPNPVRPGFSGDIKIAGLMSDAVIKITDIEGNLVYEATSEGGTVLWNQTAFGKHKVRSGVYMVFVSNSDGTETTTKKIMIIR